MSFLIRKCKRKEYIEAWREMYKNDKAGFNDPLYDGINPALNKTALKSEFYDFCVICYDREKPGSTEYGKPVGIFSFVCTPSKIIGKQYVVSKNYLRMGIGSAMLLVNEKQLIDNESNWIDKYPNLKSWYYIGCSSRSKGVYFKLGIYPYSSSEEHDLYKFNVRLDREDWNEQYKKYVEDKNFEVI